MSTLFRPFRAVLVFLRLVDAHSPGELSITNCLIYFAMGLTGYSVLQTGALDITSLVALVGALASYDRKKTRGRQFGDAEADRAALVARLDAAESRLSTLDPVAKELATVKEKVIALSNRVGVGR